MEVVTEWAYSMHEGSKESNQNIVGKYSESDHLNKHVWNWILVSQNNIHWWWITWLHSIEGGEWV